MGDILGILIIKTYTSGDEVLIILINFRYEKHRVA